MAFLQSTQVIITKRPLPDWLPTTTPDGPSVPMIALELLHNHEKMIRLNPMLAGYELVREETSTTTQITAELEQLHQKTQPQPDGLTQQPGKPGPIYLITDDMRPQNSQRSKLASILLPLPDTINYTAGFRDMVDGVLIATHAPMGVRTTSVWSIAMQNGRWMLQETATVRANWLLMSYIRKTLSEAHDKVVDSFVTAL